MILNTVCMCFTLLGCFQSVHSIQRFFMEDDCNGTLDMDMVGVPAGRLGVTRRSKYRSQLTCRVTIQAPLHRQVGVVFREMDIEYEVRCDDDFVSFYDGDSMMSPSIPGLPKRMCGNKTPTKSFASSGRALTIFFNSDIYKQNNGFEIVFTAFHKSDSCFIDEMRCNNGRCVASSLKCNDYDNCGDNSDECHVTSEVLIAIVLSVFLLTVAGVGIMTVYKKRQKQKRSEKLRDENNKPLDIRHGMISSTHCSSIDIIPCESCSRKILNSAHQKLRAQQELDRIAEKVGKENPVFTVSDDDNWLQPPTRSPMESRQSSPRASV